MRQLDAENADRDLTSQVPVLTHTPDASNPCLCQGLVLFGDGSKNLDGTGGDFELTVSVGGQAIEPDPQTITFSTAGRVAVYTSVFPVPTNAEVIIKAKSPNAGDSDVDVTAYLYDVGPIQPSTRGRPLDVDASARISVGTIAAGAITADTIAAAALNGKGDWLTSAALPANFATIAIDGTGQVSVGAIAAGAITADAIAAAALNGKGDWSTHNAAQVVSALGTGSTLSALATSTLQATDSLILATIGTYVDCLPDDWTPVPTVGEILDAMQSPGSHLDTINKATGTTLPETLATLATASALAAAKAVVDAILAQTGSDGVVVAPTAKSGYTLAADGLDAITASEPTAKPTTFPGWLMWLVQRCRRSSKTPTALTVQTEAGATVTTQTVSDDGAGTESIGAPS